MQPVSVAGRLLAIIAALTDIAAAAADLQELVETLARSLAQLEGATGAAVRVFSRERDIMAVSDPSLERVDVRKLFPLLFGRPPQLPELLHVPDTGNTKVCDPVVARTLNIRSLIASPLQYHDRCIGVLWVYSSMPHAFGREDPALVERFTPIAASIVELSLQFHEKLKESRTDNLTGLQNRRAYDESLRQTLAESQRYHTPLSLVVADVDNFKAINDRHGHVQGDAALVHVARVMQREVRGTDLVFRIGGDEFAIIMPQSEGGAAKKVMGRVGRRLRNSRNGFGRIGVTYGVSGASADDDPVVLHDRADRSLYAKKHARTA
jgi:diguanylate cyclase (GGDEF)-like protein